MTKWYNKSLGEIFSGNPKSYNPFKMWGSYVGALVIPFLFIIYGLVYGNMSCWILGSDCILTNYENIFYYFWLSIPIGFLVGWGIHSLIRRLRK